MSYSSKIPYKEREEEKYLSWVNDTKELNFPIYIISGDPFWKKETIDRMSESVGKRPEHVTDHLKKHFDKMRYKSLAGKKHFILFENKNNKLKEEDVKLLRYYLSDPSENGILLISLKDWEEKRYFLNSFKMIKRSAKVKYFDMDYTSDYFNSLYIKERFLEHQFSFESEKIRKKLIDNLVMNMSEFEDNLLTLESLETPVFSKEDIENSIEDYTDNNISKFYSALTKVNRKRVPFEILHDILGEGRAPLLVLKGIRNHFIYLYQAKYLMNRGILRMNDIEEEKKKIYISEGIIFSKPDIWELSRRRRNRFLEDSESLSIREIIYVLNLIERFTNKMRNRVGEKHVYNEYITESELFTCVIEIMNRREHF